MNSQEHQRLEHNFQDSSMNSCKELNEDPLLPLEKEIQEFEEAAQEMLERMEVMLKIVCAISSQGDPENRLEVNILCYVYILILQIRFRSWVMLNIYLGKCNNNIGITEYHFVCFIT